MICITEDQPQQSLFVYGDGKFNTKTKLLSMPESIKRYFVMKVPC